MVVFRYFREEKQVKWDRHEIAETRDIEDKTEPNTF